MLTIKPYRITASEKNMATTFNKRMREFFEFGFEQVQTKSLIKECNFIADAKEFYKDGKFERFADYTRERFENEFQCSLLFT